MAHERKARDSDGQDSADAQAFDRHRQVLEKGVYLSDSIRETRETARHLSCPDTSKQARATARVPTRHPLHPRPYNERNGTCGRGHCCIGSDAPVAVTHVLQYSDGSDFSVVGNCEKARIEHETIAAGRGTSEFSGRIEQGAFAQYTDAA